MALVLSFYGVAFLLSANNQNFSVTKDSNEYLTLSRNLSQNNVFSASETQPFEPELFRLPGYPMFLTMIGATETSDYKRVILIQCLIGMLLGFIAWPSLVKLGGRMGGIVGVAALSLDLGTVLHAPLILSEIVLQLFIVLGLIGLVQSEEGRSFKGLCISGLAWSVAALIKPIALFVPAIIALINLKDIRRTLIFAALSFALPGMWALRNSMEVKRPVYTIQGGYALLLYPASYAYAEAQHIDINEAARILEKKIIDDNPSLIKGSVEEGRAYHEEAMRIMKAHPYSVFIYCLAGTARILGSTGIDMLAELWIGEKTDRSQDVMPGSKISGQGTLRILKTLPGLIPVQIGYMLFLLGLYTLSAAGCFFLIKERRWRLALALSLPVLMMIAIAAHQGTYRFRLPLIPFMAFAAACFFARYPTLLRK